MSRASTGSEYRADVHGHGHGHQDDLDWNTLGEQLERGGEIDAPFLDGAASWLTGLASGPVTRVLDIGSGPGVATCRLAAAFPGAEVVAVDGSPDLLERAVARAERLGVREQVVTRHAELPDGFADLGAADLVWTSHVMHHLGDQQAALASLASLLRPGGLLAVAEGGLTARYLPRDIGIGRAGLQSRLDVAAEEWFAAMRASLPGSAEVVEDWAAMLDRAGLGHVATRSFLTDLPAPVDDGVREHVYGMLERCRDEFGDRLDPDDRTTVERLLDRDSPDGVVHRKDLYLLRASTVHVARSG